MDPEPVRRSARRAYERARRQLDARQAELDAFARRDLPEYGRWLHATFGQLLTDIRAVRDTIQDRMIRIEQVELAAEAWQCSARRAFARMEAGEPFPVPEPATHAGSESGDAGGETWFDQDIGDGQSWPDEDEDPDEDEEEDELDEELAEVLRALFGDAFDRRSSRRHPPGGNPPGRPDPGRNRAKALYRRIALRVHPDMRGEMTPAVRRIWDEAQAAYGEHDAARLEALLLQLDIEAGTDTGEAPVGLLQTLTRDLRRRFEQLGHELRSRRLEPAWGFARRTDRAMLALRMRFDLTRNLATLRRELAQVDRKLAKYAAPRRPATAPAADAPRAGPGATSDPAQLELPF